MKINRIITQWLALAALAMFSLQPFTAFAQSTMFTYQGRVLDNGAAFTGTGQFKFALVTSAYQNSTATAYATLPYLGGGVMGDYLNNIFVGNPGSGYVTPPAVSFSGGGGSGATATANISGGSVTSITINNAGSGYTSPPTVTLAPPPADPTYTTYWSNDGTGSDGSEPTSAVSVGVTNGLFTVVLGDTTQTNMQSLDASLFTQPNLQLRIWFNDGVNGSAVLSPVQNLTPTPYAIMANLATSANTANNLLGTLPAAQLSGGTANISISGSAATAVNGVVTTGTYADPSWITSLSGSKISGNISGSATSITGTLPVGQLGAGTANINISGSAASITDTLPVGQLSGIIPLALLPAAVVTNDSANLTIGGTTAIAPLTVPSEVPVSVGSVGTGSDPESVAVAGRYAYVVSQNGDSLQVFDVSTPSAPVLIGSVGTGSSAISIAVAGRYAYVANNGASKLQIFDVSTPSAPVLVGTASTGSSPYSIAVAGRYAYVVNLGANTLQIFDVGTPSVPVLVGSVGTASQPHSVAVAGRYAYVVGGSSTLQIFDVGIPSAPVSVGSVATSSYSFSLAVAGRYAYVAVSGANMLQIFDVSTSSAPALVGSVGAGNDPYSVAVAGRYAYVVNYADGTFQVFDVSTPSAPVSIGSVTTTSGPESVAVAGRYAYVSDYSLSKLRIFDLGGAYLQQLEAGAMEAGTLQTRDTVTVGNNLDVRGGLTVSASARISGGLSVDNGTISGNGSGLTNLNAASSVSNLTVTGDVSLPAFTVSQVIVSNGVLYVFTGVINEGGNPFIHSDAVGDFFGGWNAGLGGIGSFNTAVGAQALCNNFSGSNNIALGYQAGYNITTGNNNIDIGNTGSSDDSGVIRIGMGSSTNIVQTSAYIAGISGTTVAGGSAVYVTTSGQLGIRTSSERFKQDIQNMGDQSDALLALHPVTFKYKPELDPQGIPQFGLVAEEVAKVNPELVLRDDQNRIYSVRYEAVNAMLLNEFLKEHKTVEAQKTEIQAQGTEIQDLKQSVAELKAMVEKLTGK